MFKILRTRTAFFFANGAWIFERGERNRTACLASRALIASK